MKRKLKSNSNRSLRHERIRKKISGTTERPRLYVYRSTNHLEAQLIDDLNHKTLASVSTRSKSIKDKLKYCGNVKGAEVLGEAIASVAKDKGIGKVVFDRGGYLYHGRVKAFAESARTNGLEF